MPKSSVLQKWGELYKAAIEFKKLKPWEWMYDSDLFGVQNPQSGEIGYCCVMGAIGEHYALAVYTGSRGLQSYWDLAGMEPDFSEDDALYDQKCLQLSFEDRDMLQKKDIDIIKKLGLTFRGKNNWPLFRDYAPGLFPWFLKNEDIEYLTVAIQQAINVCWRVKTNPGLIEPPPEKGGMDDDYYFVRVAEKENSTLVWRDKWLTPKPFEEEEIGAVPPDQIRIHKILKTAEQTNLVWEFDSFYLPEPTVERKNDRPYFPVALLWGDQSSDLILATDLVKKTEYHSRLIPQFYQLMESSKLIPATVWTVQEDVCILLEEVTNKLGIDVELVDELPAINVMKENMLNYFFGHDFV